MRSSYEYCFAKYLEKLNIKYKVEEKEYNLKNKNYTPDFFLYNENNKLYEIVEIRGYRLNIEERIEDVEELQLLLKRQIKVTLLTELDLKNMLSNVGLSYDKLSNEWKNSPETIRNNNSKDNNHMYGKKHSQETKNKIGEKSKERFKDDIVRNKISERIKEKWEEGCYNSLKEKRSKRVVKKCESCGKEFYVTYSESKTRKYCSKQCAAKNANKFGVESIKDKRNNMYEEIKNFAIEWAIKNKECIVNIKYNNIKQLDILYTEIFDKFSIKDWRTICKAILQKENGGKREIIKLFKKII